MKKLLLLFRWTLHRLGLGSFCGITWTEHLLSSVILVVQISVFFSAARHGLLVDDVFFLTLQLHYGGLKINRELYFFLEFFEVKTPFSFQIFLC